MYTKTRKEQEISFVSSKWSNWYHRWSLWSIYTSTSRGLHSHEHAKIFQHAKKKIKVVSEVLIWINHNFSHEFNDDVNEWSAVQWKINIITEHQNTGTLADNYM